MAAAHAWNLSDLLDGIPAGAWVAISERRHAVLSYGAELQKVVDSAKAQGEQHPLIVKVPDKSAALFF